MSMKKQEKSNLVGKNAGDELEQMPSKFTIRGCDVAILVVSFVFTIMVACCILLYINNDQLRNVAEIETIVGRILDERAIKAMRTEFADTERKRGYLEKAQVDEDQRSKRAIHDFRDQANGKKTFKFKNSA